MDPYKTIPSSAIFQRMCDVMRTAFVDDPLWVAVCPEKDRRNAFLYEFESVYLRYAIKFGDLYSVGQPIAGVSMWFPPHREKITTWGMIQSGILRIFLSAFRHELMKANALFEYGDKMHKQIVPEAHYYLTALAVHPESQGKKFASQLLRPILTRIDTIQCPIYLETMNPKDLPLYEHFGFQIKQQIDLPQYDLQIWGLRKN